MSKESLVPSYISLGLQALIPITLGSFKSLKTPQTVLARRKALRKKTDILTEDVDDDDEEDLDETLTWTDTLIFPIFGSAALLGLWALLKYAGPEWINFFLGIYFSGAGMFAFHSTFSSIIDYVSRLISYKPSVFHLRITKNLNQFYHLPISSTSLLLLPVSIILPALYLPLKRPYLLSNLLASCLATTSLALLKLDSFFTAFLLLALLLVYDIFWVFATPVMVTVAKGIDAPIKILSPRSSSRPNDFAMLGLGDIVVPGLVIALCLRFDLYRHAVNHPRSNDVGPYSKFGKSYFGVAVVSYVLGLGVTMGVMHWTRHAQPALLYLSPACTLGPVLLALARGELKALWSFSDAPLEEDKVKALVAGLDDTIEPPSETAMKARQATRNSQVEELAQDIGELAEADEVEDDSWMDGPVGTSNGSDAKLKKRKGGKKK